LSEPRRKPSQPRSNGRKRSPVVKAITELASDRKATDIVAIDLASIPETSPVTDYFVLCTGRSDVHVHAICERIVEGMRSRGISPISTEGVERGQWALLDYGDVVVHVFQEPVRRHYDLERLWALAPRFTYRDGSDIEERLA
jgi:ribosome-associated protein